MGHHEPETSKVVPLIRGAEAVHVAEVEVDSGVEAVQPDINPVKTSPDPLIGLVETLNGLLKTVINEPKPDLYHLYQPAL